MGERDRLDNKIFAIIFGILWNEWGSSVVEQPERGAGSSGRGKRWVGDRKNVHHCW